MAVLSDVTSLSKTGLMEMYPEYGRIVWLYRIASHEPTVDELKEVNHQIDSILQDRLPEIQVLIFMIIWCIHAFYETSERVLKQLKVTATTLAM